MVPSQRFSGSLGPNAPGRAVLSGRTVFSTPTSTAAGDGGGVTTPAVSNTLNAQISRYQRYRITQCVFEYVPLITATSSPGTVAMSVLTDPKDAATFAGASASSQWTLAMQSGGQATPVYRNLVYRIPREAGLGEWKYSYQTDSGGSSDRRLETPFWLAWGILGASATAAQGVIMMTYTIELEGVVNTTINP